MSMDNSMEDELALSQESEVNMIHLQSQPSCIQGTMRDYQLAALNWLLNQHQLGLNSILADEMGFVTWCVLTRRSWKDARDHLAARLPQAVHAQ